ncbi:hypothetical protein I6E74_10065 [Salinibacterium sp. SWN139]|uniref:hypothetical protein n=1 Tax=Salinibacterium sp. SWN139 TaxID=2792055 RepID=UPI0018CF1B2B|nr:hypothetical protein [Salinibacterium sp. SWN139]MBH0054509.1 hypothetical protein [Salinibacterium sp. SWN139]
MMSPNPARMTPDQARDLFFETIRAMHPDEDLSRAINDAEDKSKKHRVGFQPNPEPKHER